MINLKRNLVIGLIALLMLLLTAIGIQEMRIKSIKSQRDSALEDVDQLRKFTIAQKDSIKYYINAYNDKVAKTEVLELDLNNVNKLKDTERLSFLSRFNTLNKKIKNLESAASFDMTLFGDSIPVITKVIPCQDSIKLFQYYYHDEFNQIEATVLDTPKISINIPLYSVVLWERQKKFLFIKYGKKKWYVESTTPNKLVNINKQELIRIDKK